MEETALHLYTKAAACYSILKFRCENAAGKRSIIWITPAALIRPGLQVRYIFSPRWLWH